MKALCDALAFAMAYLGGFPREAYGDEDNDCKALESIAAWLSDATSDELAELKSAALRAIKRERDSQTPNYTLIVAYEDVANHINGN